MKRLEFPGRWWSALRREPPPLKKAMVRFLLDLSVGALLGVLIGMIPAVHTLGRNALDAFQVFEPEEAARHVVLVNITSKTFREKFCGRSPLDPETLLGLLKKIADVDPLLIAVDIDTSHRDFGRIETSLGSPTEIGKTPVIWARGGACEGKDCEDQKFELDKVLAEARPAEDASRFGLAVFQRERDGMVREFTRCVQAYIGGDVCSYPTFHWSIAQSIRSDPGSSRPKVREPHNPCKVKVNDDQLVIPRIRYQFAEVDAGDLIDAVSCDKLPGGQPCVCEPGEDVRPVGSGVEGAPAGPDSADATNGTPRDSLTPAGERKDIFKDKIVLVGGAYDQRDKHPTAFGEIDGYYLLARAIEAERSGRLTRQEPDGVRLAMDVGLALLIACFHYMFVHLFAGLLTALMMTLIPIVVSFQLFAASDYWLDALPFLIGFWVTEAYFAGPLTAVVEKIFPDRAAPMSEERTEMVIEEEIANDGSGRRNITIQGWRRWRGRILGPKA